MKIGRCKVCGAHAELQRDGGIFIGQIYSDRYPEKVANQNHGYRIRCLRCGLQTCWWHYEKEAITHWNSKPEDWKKE